MAKAAAPADKRPGTRRQRLFNTAVHVLMIAVVFCAWDGRLWKILTDERLLSMFKTGKVGQLLDFVNPFPKALMKNLDAEFQRKCGDVVAPWCLPEHDKIVRLLNGAGFDKTGRRFQSSLWRVFEVYLQFPRAWGGFLYLLEEGHPWTKPFCETVERTAYLPQLVLLDQVKLPRYTLGEFRRHHPEVAGPMEAWLAELRDAGSPELEALVGAALGEGDALPLNGRSMKRVVQFCYSRVVSLVLSVCSEASDALFQLEGSQSSLRAKNSEDAEDSEDSESSDGSEGSRGERATLLHAVAGQGNSAMAEVLLYAMPDSQRGRYLAAQDQDGYTAEHWALLNHYNDTALLLRNHSAEMGAKALPTRALPSPDPWPENTDVHTEERDARAAGGDASGGWDTKTPSAAPPEWLPDSASGGCTFDTADVRHFDWESFLRNYVIHPRPLLIRGGARMRAGAMRAYTRKGLMEVAGDTKVRAQAFPYADHQVNATPLEVTIRDYVNFLGTRKEDGPQDRLQYVFEVLGGPSNKNLSFAHLLPKIAEDKIRPFNVQFSLGGDLMGAPPHQHENAFNSLRHGRKLWMLQPPAQSFWRNEAVYSYMLRTKGAPEAMRCIQEAGDVIFMPSGWMHATMCLSDCVGMAAEFTLDGSKDVPRAYQNLSIHHIARNDRVK